MRLSVWGPAPALNLSSARAAAPALGSGRVVFDGEALRGGHPPRRAARRDLARGAGAVRAAGVHAADRARVARAGQRARHDPAAPRGSAVTLDPIELQVVTGALHAACQEMGVALIRSAHSSNIKERRDASTALFDTDGQMVMQAEHIPVHLGAMPAAVAAVVAERHRPGVSWILNDPFAGGTHLPDITVITPVFTSAGEALGFAASRAHHADVGGRVPGSMPADSRSLSEEGVVISPRTLDEETIDELSGQMRQPQERRADLRAQLAANRTGALRLARARRASRGAARLREATDAVLDYSERRTRACLARAGRRLAPGRGRARGRRRRPRPAPARRGPRRTPAARLLRQRAAARGQPQLSAGRHALGLPVRAARADATPTSPPRRARTVRSRCSRRWEACSTRAPARRSRRATWRPPRASPIWC